MGRDASVGNRTAPWGTTVGLVVAAAVTIIGAARTFEPTVIMYRAVIAAVVVGSVVAVARAVFVWLNSR
jgi:hypothetical protein